MLSLPETLNAIIKDAMSDFWPIWPQNFDLKFNRYFDRGRESYKLSFEPLFEKVRQLFISSSEMKCSKWSDQFLCVNKKRFKFLAWFLTIKSKS